MIILIFHDEYIFQKCLASFYDFLAKSGKQAKFWVSLSLTYLQINERRPNYKT